MKRSVIRSIGVTLLVAALVGCTGSAATNGRSAVATSSPAVSTARPSTPAPSASPSTEVVAKQLCADARVACPLAAGRYSSAPFEHPFTFTVKGRNWANERALFHFGSVRKGANDRFEWASGITHGLVDGAGDTSIGPTPQDLIDHLRKSRRLTVTKPKPVTVDGLSGLRVDVVATGETRRIFFFSTEAWSLAPGEKARFIVLDNDGAAVVLIVESFKKAGFEAFMTDVAQPIIDGLTWD